MDSELILLKKTLALMEARITELEMELYLKVANFVDQGKIIDLYAKKNVLIIYDKYSCLESFKNEANELLSFQDTGVNLIPLMNLYLYLYHHVIKFDDLAHYTSKNNDLVNSLIIKKYLYVDDVSQMRTEIYNLTSDYNAFYYNYKNCEDTECNCDNLGDNYVFDLIYQYPVVSNNAVTLKKKTKHIFKYPLKHGYNEFSYLGRQFAHMKFYLIKLVNILNEAFNNISTKTECFSQRHHFNSTDIYHSIFHFNTKNNTLITNNLSWTDSDPTEKTTTVGFERTLLVKNYGQLNSIPTKNVSNLAFRISEDGTNNGLFFANSPNNTNQIFNSTCFSFYNYNFYDQSSKKTFYGDKIVMTNTGLFYHTVIDRHSVDEKISIINVTDTSTTIKFYNIYMDKDYEFSSSNNLSVHVINGQQLFSITINEMLHFLHTLNIGQINDGYEVIRLIDLIIINSLINELKNQNRDTIIKKINSITFTPYTNENDANVNINDCFTTENKQKISYYYKSFEINCDIQNSIDDETTIKQTFSIEATTLLALLQKILAYILYYI